MTSTVSSLPKEQHGPFIGTAMMALLSTGQLVGWGSNSNYNLANGFETSAAAVMQAVIFDPNTTGPPSTATIVDWAFTNGALYVVYSNGWVYSSGGNAYGELGHGDTTARPFLKRIEYFVTNGISVTKVWASGSAFTSYGGGCVYFQASNYSMYACGENVAGNLGNASTPLSNVSTPAPCAGIPNSPQYVIDVRSACINTSFSTYMLFSDGSVMVAGNNGNGQLGNNSTTNVSGTFVTAQQSGGSALSNIAAIYANGDYYFNGNNWLAGGNASAVDTSGNVWTVGWNGYGQLGLGTTTDVHQYTKIPTLSNVVDAKIVGGYPSYGYALTASGSLYTWGYNTGQLFQNTATNPITIPTIAANAPASIAKVFWPVSEALSFYPQLMLQLTDGALVSCGATNGQQGISVGSNIVYIATPPQILNGSETISRILVHGIQATQRWFILSNLGKLYACGNNTNSICTGGYGSSSAPASVEWYQIQFP